MQLGVVPERTNGIHRVFIMWIITSMLPPTHTSIPSLSMQFRIIIYAAMGLIQASDWGLYSACIGCHAVGMLLGNQAGRIISQATFNLLLLGRFHPSRGGYRRGDARKRH